MTDASARNLRHRLAEARARARIWVLVFHAGAAVYLLATVLSALAAPALRHVASWAESRAASAALAPLLLDGPKLLLLFSVAYPMGRLLRGRSLPVAFGLTGTVYALDILVSWVLGTLPVVWGNAWAALGRGVLAVLGAAGVAGLVARGRRASSGGRDGSRKERTAR